MKRKRPLADALARGRPRGPTAAAAGEGDDDDDAAAFAELSEAAVGVATLHRDFCGLLPVVPTAAQALLAPRSGGRAFETVCPLRVALFSQLADVTRRGRGSRLVRADAAASAPPAALAGPRRRARLLPRRRR
jgi:hypothetical protein